MAYPHRVKADRDGARCAVPSCSHINPQLYDDLGERYFCDWFCFVEYVAENAEEFAKYYADLNVYETGGGW